VGEYKHFISFSHPPPPPPQKKKTLTTVTCVSVRVYHKENFRHAWENYGEYLVVSVFIIEPL
jgi:hypothetical protein